MRHIQRGTSPADPNVQNGPSIDFQSEAANSRQDDGATRECDDDRTFEMALHDGLVISLQAYDPVTRDECVKRLDALIKYWGVRCADDAAQLEAVRQWKLKLLETDDKMESIIG